MFFCLRQGTTILRFPPLNGKQHSFRARLPRSGRPSASFRRPVWPPICHRVALDRIGIVSSDRFTDPKKTCPFLSPKSTFFVQFRPILVKKIIFPKNFVVSSQRKNIVFHLISGDFFRESVPLAGRFKPKGSFRKLEFASQMLNVVSSRVTGGKSNPSESQRRSQFRPPVGLGLEAFVNSVGLDFF